MGGTLFEKGAGGGGEIGKMGKVSTYLPNMNKFCDCS